MGMRLIVCWIWKKVEKLNFEMNVCEYDILLFALLLPLFENELYPLLLSNLIPILLL